MKVVHIDRNETSTIIQLLETGAVQNQDATVRRAAIEALGKTLEALPQQDSDIIQQLLIAARDQEFLVQDNAICALEKVSSRYLLESYWAKQDPRFIPYITTRLYYTTPSLPKPQAGPKLGSSLRQ